MVSNVVGHRKTSWSFCTIESVSTMIWMRPNKYPMVISVTTLSSGPHCPSPDGGQCGGGAKIWQSVRNTEAIIIITHTQCMLSAQWPIPWLQYHIIIIHNTNRLWLDTRQNVARWLSRRQWTIPKAWPRLKEQNTLFPSRLGWRCKSIWWVIISPQTVRKLCPGPGLSFHSWVGRGPWSLDSGDTF